MAKEKATAIYQASGHDTRQAMASGSANPTGIPHVQFSTDQTALLFRIAVEGANNKKAAAAAHSAPELDPLKRKDKAEIAALSMPAIAAAKVPASG